MPRLAAAAVLGAVLGVAIVSAASEPGVEREQRYYVRHRRVVEQRCYSCGCYE